MTANVRVTGACFIYVKGMDFTCPLCGELVRSGEQHTCKTINTEGRDMPTFEIGSSVRYKPGQGTYGYEHLLEQDGRVPATVVGHTARRVTIEFAKAVGGGRALTTRRAVDAQSLVKA